MKAHRPKSVDIYGMSNYVSNCHKEPAQATHLVQWQLGEVHWTLLTFNIVKTCQLGSKMTIRTDKEVDQ